MLSQRIIHVLGEEMLWECREATNCECASMKFYREKTKGDRLSFGLDMVSFTLKEYFDDLLNGGKGSASSFDLWQALIKAYSGLKITHEGDRLAALSGVARQVARGINGTYLAGIWKDDPPGALLWATKGLAKRRINSGIPTWSWAFLEFMDTSTSNFIWYPFGRIAVDKRVTVIDADCISDPFTSPTGGTITLKCAAVSGRIVLKKFRHEEHDPFAKVYFNGGQKVPVTLDFATNIREIEQVMCILIGTPTTGRYLPSCLFLVLEKNNGEETYKRVGVIYDFFDFYQTSTAVRIFDNAPVATISIA